jgi:hypothetical protein
MMDPAFSDELWRMIHDDPEMMEILKGYLKIWRAAKEGRLSREGMERFEALNEYIHNAAA